MSSFEKIITSSITNTVKSTAKFDTAVNLILDKFKNECPDKETLKNIIQQKNNIYSALTQVRNNIKNIQSTSQTVSGIIEGVNSSITLIKSIPIPTSTPPGIGIPVSVIVVLSDSLNKLSVLLQTFEGPVSIISPAIETINNYINNILQKLKLLDDAILKCLEKTISNLNEEEKNNYLNKIGFSLTPNTQSSDSENFPITYKGFTLTLQNNINNKFSIPQRRIQAENKNGVVLFNTDNGQYSYSSSTKVLMDEAKFRIDSYISSLK
jgi:prefoldin subunit 5